MNPDLVAAAIKNADATMLLLWAWQIIGAAYSLWTTWRAVSGTSRAAWRAGRNWRESRLLVREQREQQKRRQAKEERLQEMADFLDAYTGQRNANQAASFNHASRCGGPAI